MKTVGEFKKAGLVFVEGDERSSIHKGHGNVQMTKGMAFGTNKDDKTDRETVISFAWRENTGVKPEFSGAIDAIIGVGDDSEQIECAPIDDFQWDLDHSCPTVKWRPSLNQPQQWPDNAYKQVEVIINNNTPFSIELAEKGGFSYELKAASSDKPVFTQAVADSGELPPVGAKAKVCIEKAGFNIDNSDLKFEGKVVIIRAAFANEEGEKIVAIENEDGNCACFIIECIEPLDTRTDREKAIDAALSEWPIADKATLEMAYDFWRVGDI